MTSYNQQNSDRFIQPLSSLLFQGEQLLHTSKPKPVKQQKQEMKGGNVKHNKHRTKKHVKKYKPQQSTYEGGNPNVDIIVDKQVIEPVRRKITRKTLLNEREHHTVRMLLKDLFD